MDYLASQTEVTDTNIGVGAGGIRGSIPPSFESRGDNPPHFSGKNVCKNYVTWSLITTNDGINCVI